MSFSGGVYTLPGPALATGEVVSATENNQFRNDVAGAFNLTFLRNGTSTATANLPMGGYKLTGLGVATTSGDALSYGQAAVISDFTASGTVTISSGTANGVAYLNGSKVLTTGSALTFDGTNLGLGSSTINTYYDRTQQIYGTASSSLKLTNATAGTANTDGFDIALNGTTAIIINREADALTFGTNNNERMRLDSSGNLGLGVTPSAWSVGRAMQIGTTGAAIADGSGSMYWANNAYYNAGWKYLTNAGASYYAQAGNAHQWQIAPSGTAGNAISFTQAMTLDANGNLGIGTSSPSSALHIQRTGANVMVLATTVTSGNPSVYLDASGTNYGTLFVDRANAGITTLQAGGSLILQTNGANERMRIDSSGNVFVGGTTALAGSREAVYGDTSNQGSGTYPATLELIDTRAYNSTSPQAGGGVAFGYKYTSGGAYALGPSIQGFKENSTDGNYAAGLKFSTRPNGSNPAEAMRIDSSGNVGIGTSSPSGKLHVYQDTTGTTSIRIQNPNTGGGANTALLLNGDSGEGSVIVSSAAGGDAMAVRADSNLSGGLYLDTIAAAPIILRTNFTERMRIDSSGRVLVGTTTAPGGGGNDGVKGVCISPGDPSSVIIQNKSDANMYLAKVSGYTLGDFVQFYVNGTQVGKIYTGGTTTTYATSSDYRLKENIQPMQNALGVVAQLNPVTYTWKADGSDGQGFIAHELQAVVPDCVTGEKDAVDAEGNPVYQGIDTSFLVATLCKAIQELEARVKQLEGK